MLEESSWDRRWLHSCVCILAKPVADRTRKEGSSTLMPTVGDDNGE
jgi:hypothetical protein